MPITNRLYEKSTSAIIAPPPPLGLLNYTNKSIASWSTDVSNNISISFLTYDKNISKIINTGYNTSGWVVDWFAPLNNSGYAIFLFSTNGPQRWVAIFYDYEGNEVGKYEAETNNVDYDTLHGQFMYLIDYTNHKIAYSDGIVYQTYEYDHTVDTINILNWYDNTLDNGFIIYESTLNNNGDLYKYSLATPNGVYQLGPALNGNYENSSPLWNRTANFIVLFHYTNSNQHTHVSLFSNTGQFIRDIILPTDHTYNDFNVDFYGTNKVSILFYDNNDNTVPYLIYNYDGNRNKLLMTHHDRHPNFSDYEVYYDSHHNSHTTDNYLSEDIHYVFYGESDGYNYSLITVGYADILSMFNGDTEFKTYTITNSGNYEDFSIGLYSNFIGSSFIIPVINYTEDHPNVKLLNIQNSSTFYKTIRSVNDLDTLNIWSDMAGNNYILALFTIYATDGTVYVFDGKSGDLRDSKVFTSNINWWYNYDTMYFVDYGVEGNVSWYMNSASLKFQLIEYTNPNIYTTNNYIAGPPYNTPGNVMLFNSNTGRTRVITRTKFYDFTLPISTGGWDLAIGNDVILYQYISNNTHTTILYNLKGEYQDASVSLPSYSNYFNLAGNRAYINYNNGNDTISNYIFKPGIVKLSTLSSTYNNYPAPNDWYYWN